MASFNPEKLPPTYTSDSPLSPAKVPDKAADKMEIDEKMASASKSISGASLTAEAPLTKPVKVVAKRGAPIDDFTKDETAKAFERAKTHNPEKFNTVMQTLEKLEKQLRADEGKDFDKASFDIVSCYLSTLYMTIPYSKEGHSGSDETYGNAYRNYIWNKDAGSVQNYLELCLDHLPQDIVNDLAENVTTRFLYYYYKVDRKDDQFIHTICSHATHASRGMLFAGAYFNDPEIMIRCLRNPVIDRFALNAIGESPLEVASKETLETVLKADGGSILKQADVDFAQKVAQKRKRETEEYPKLPKVHTYSRRRGGVSEAMQQLFTSNLKHGGRGRYGTHNYLALEKTLVKFKDLKTYYHANHVLDGIGIASEAPLKSTAPAFWQMIIETGTGNILMLTEFGDEQCFDYCKTSKYGNIEVEQVGEKEVVFTNGTQSLEKRVFRTNDGKDTKEVIHWHVANWPDVSVVPAPFLADLVKHFAEGIKDGKIKKMLAHCMAGIGRTGTFYATLKAYLNFLEGDKSDDLVFKSATKLREERHGSIQTLEQYRLVHSALDILKAQAGTTGAGREREEKKA